jgi:O-antigen/teichoic acid export membrane protein
MSRLKNFARGVVSGYVQMAVNVVFTMASVPLALHYLSKSEFALWALVSQITGYLALIDLGMSVSVARILADHKDDRDGGVYGAVLKSGQVVFTIQAVLIGVASVILAPFIADCFQIEASMRTDFILLIRGNGLVLAFLFATKIAVTPFWSFQRYDVLNHANSVALLLGLAVLAWGFESGFGVKSTIFALMADALLKTTWGLVACWKLGFFPRRGAWGRMDRKLMSELLHFGRDVFLMALGVQLLSASQVIIVTRRLGLEAGATWAIASKGFALAQQAVNRIYENSAGALTEMVVRGERDRLRDRFRDIVALTASLGVVIAIIGAAVNGSFLAVWTHGRVSWPLATDVLMACYVAVICFARCQTGFAGLTKNIRVLRFIYFFEGLTFFAVAWVVAGQWGFTGIAAASLLAAVLWSGAYGVKRSCEYFGCSVWELCSWLRPAAFVALALAPIAGVTGWVVRDFSPEWRLGVLTGTLGLAASGLFVTIGLPKTLRKEIFHRVRLRLARTD